MLRLMEVLLVLEGSLPAQGGSGHSSLLFCNMHRLFGGKQPSKRHETIVMPT